MSMQYTRFLLIALLTCSLSACANVLPVYHPQISQGNPQIHKNHNKITIGMTRSKVESLLGKPLLNPLFSETNTWTYVHQTANNQRIISESLTITFNTKGLVNSVTYKPPKEHKQSTH
jgi:outer membrane protein assembly factor BamE